MSLIQRGDRNAIPSTVGKAQEVQQASPESTEKTQRVAASAMEAANHDLSNVLQQLRECPTDLLGLIFSNLSWDDKPNDYLGTEKADYNRVASFYLALKEKEQSSENPDAFLLNRINHNIPLCLDTLPHEDFYGFIARNGDMIKTLNLSGEALPENLIEVLKEKYPNLNRLIINSRNFNQPVEGLQALTNHEIHCAAFNQP